MTDTVDKNKKDESSSHSVLDFLVRIVSSHKKPPICQEEHDWILVDGTGYDYKADYYLCKKYELKIPQQEF